MFEEKLPQYLALVEKDAAATKYLREAEKFFDTVYQQTTDAEIRSSAMRTLVDAQLGASYHNKKLADFVQKYMEGKCNG